MLSTAEAILKESILVNRIFLEAAFWCLMKVK